MGEEGEMLSVDLFYCIGPPRFVVDQGQTLSHADMISEVVNRWLAESRVRFRPLSCDRAEDQKSRRVRADNLASGRVYILADDDCLPQLKPFVLSAWNLAMSMSGQYGMLSLMPDNANIYPWSEGEEDRNVMEHVSVGGIRFCVKGAMEKWPPMEGPGYDRTHADQLRRQGLKVGYFKDFKMTHLGEGSSTVWGL